ncbi:hypothetical protein MESS4_20068 [Mesorhizobium sp. STM 4661]|nr:hypothetical protein MESS4_20068 [Mesorhizobium sp. STM 4661]
MEGCRQVVDHLVRKQRPIEAPVLALRLHLFSGDAGARPAKQKRCRVARDDSEQDEVQNHHH